MRLASNYLRIAPLYRPQRQIQVENRRIQQQRARGEASYLPLSQQMNGCIQTSAQTSCERRNSPARRVRGEIRCGSIVLKKSAVAWVTLADSVSGRGLSHDGTSAG